MRHLFEAIIEINSSVVLFCSVSIIHNVFMFMGDSGKYKEAEDPDYEYEVISRINEYHERMKQIVISQKDDGEKPINMVFSSISFAGGGFRTISYAPSVFYLYESKRIDENTTYHGKQANKKATNYAHFICPVP